MSSKSRGSVRRSSKRSVRSKKVERRSAKRSVRSKKVERRSAKRSVRSKKVERRSAKRSIRRSAKRSVRSKKVERRSAKRSVRSKKVERRSSKRSAKRSKVEQRSAKRSIKMSVRSKKAVQRSAKRLAKRSKVERRSTKKKASKKKMNPISLQFRIEIIEEILDINSDGEKPHINSLTEDAKSLFIDTIKNRFVKTLRDVSGVTITNIKIDVSDDYFTLHGKIPVKLDDVLYGVSLKNWIDAIDEKSVWQLKYGPTNEDFVESNGKNYNLFSVHIV